MSTLFHLTNAKYSSHALTLYIAYNTKLPNIAIVLLLSVHLDIKSFPILFYHKYWYIITFFDDFTSYGWSAMLHTKSAALQAAKLFFSMVSIQYDAKVKGWMSNVGGEYRSKAFDKLLADNRITAYQSAPHIPQQNGHTEYFM